MTELKTDRVLGNERLLAHEQFHSAQCAAFCAGYPDMYARFEIDSNLAGLGPAFGNLFEY